MLNLHCKKPCKNCPFRKGTMKGWLGKSRITKILKAESFVCHKTTQGKMFERLQCAGHMILNGEKNEYVRLANIFEMPLNLKGQELIFDSKKECIEKNTTT